MCVSIRYMTTQTHQQGGRVPADTLRARLILLRDELGLSQREAAEKSGITYAEWQSLENNRDARGMIRKIGSISAAFGYNRDWLLWGGGLGVPPAPDDDDTPGHAQRPRAGSNRRPTAYNSDHRARLVAA